MASSSSELQFVEATIVQWNCRGLDNKKGDIMELFRAGRPSILCFNEVKCRRKPSLSGYVTYVDQKRQHMDHFSAATFVKIGVNATLIQLSTPVDLDYVVIMTTLAKQKCYIINVYLAHDSNDIADKLSKIIEQLQKFPILLLGDFNAKHQLWGSPLADSRGRELVKFLDDNDLVSLNGGEATYVSSSHMGVTSHIDVTTSTTSLGGLLSWSISSELLGSDHYPIFLADTTLQKSRCKKPITDWNLYRTILLDLIKSKPDVPLSDHVKEAKRSATTLVTVP